MLRLQENKIINRNKIVPAPEKKRRVKKVYSISEYEGALKVLKKDRNENICFESHRNAGAGRHYENKDLSEKYGE